MPSLRSSSIRLSSRFRADHVGSLLRPSPLYEMRRNFERGLCSPEDLRKAEDDAIKHVVRLQKTIGTLSLTDGELRRSVFFEGVFEKLEGMTFVPDRPISEFKGYIPHIKLMVATGTKKSPTIFCNGKIRRTSPFYVDQFKYMKKIVAPEDVSRIKITMCSPSWFHQRHGSDLTYDLSVYKDDDEYFDDLGVAYRQEIQELYSLGCRKFIRTIRLSETLSNSSLSTGFIQIDDPTFCYFCDEGMVSGMKEAGVNREALLDTYIRAINRITKDRPSDLQVAIHLCRGNYKGQHFSAGGYARIAKKVFNKLDVDTLYLEYDTDRAGDFAPLKHLPLNRKVVLGLVTTKSGILEPIGLLKDRVNEAVGVLMKGIPKRSRETALNQLSLSTQCGFASVWEGNPVTETDQKAKLALLVEASRQIWGP